ncbi:hypothetical protein E4631_22785 [Hymenobacter sp. UV11]|uniref:hypothetical protein n=1 Tax=Hymenobacter sp. UV11 TaxID=1849735 RepID=UPI0010616F9D|nr:hypothetical protein [Hymenobacter sp. UV11]TFZ63322.1 hypothetical protein E4631_22785 [Hymenobacter sp. UV11]
MKLQRIISLANKNSELQFLAMCRSLRATGCDLPIWVIPYNDKKFELPENCIWWEVLEITTWIDKNRLWPAFKKIQCFLTENYQYVDSDVIFLKNPALVLQPLSGFITSCTHWNNPNETLTSETKIYFKNKSTLWPKLVFNSGQWACDTQLYNLYKLISFCETNYKDTLFHKNYLYKDQAGINLLVNYTNIEITNLTLPPFNMESTWAGDYLEEASFRRLDGWREKPYLIHWAGTPVTNYDGINSYFFQFLTESEKTLFSLSPVKIGYGRTTLKAKVKMICKIILNK